VRLTRLSAAPNASIIASSKEMNRLGRFTATRRRATGVPVALQPSNRNPARFEFSIGYCRQRL
jgi:hypothetical protein